MRNWEKISERRKHERFDIKASTFAVLSYDPPAMGHIINMSTGGISVRYTGKEKPISKSKQIDMLRPSVGFYLNQIPVTTVSEHTISDKMPASSENVLQRHLQFSSLTDDQKTQINHFIQNNASMITRSGKDRRKLQDQLYSGPENRTRMDRRQGLQYT